MLNLFNKKTTNTFNFLNNKDMSRLKSELNLPFFLKKGNDIGIIKHYPSSTQEWFNSVYAFNKHFTKMLPVSDLTVNRLFQSYFNLNPIFDKDMKFRRRRVKARRGSISRIFTSRAEIKHTNRKVFITVYTFNKKKKDFLHKIKVFKKNLEKTSIKTFLKLKEFKENSLSIKHLETSRAFKDFFIKKNFLNKNIKNKNIKYDYKYLNLVYRDLVKANKINTNRLEKSIFNFFLKKENFLRQAYMINEYKFKTTFLLGLNRLIAEIFQKKVEINIVNLKYFYLNSDLLSYSIATKLKDRKNRIVKVLTKALRLVKLPMENMYKAPYDPKKIYNKILDYKNIVENKDILQQVFSKIFFKKIEKISKLKNVSDILEKNVFYTLKHKKIKGVRLEGSGRLTRRLTASRSIFKVKYKGGLKNIDSSYKNLSTVMLKGYMRSNIQYINVNSKTRNGAFGLKGWVSSY